MATASNPPRAPVITPSMRKRSPDELVPGADELHDLDLLPSGEDGNANRGADDEGGDHGEGGTEHGSGHPTHAPQREELVDPFLTVLNVFDDRENLRLPREAVDRLAGPTPRSKLDLEGGRERIYLQVRQDLSKLGEFPARFEEGFTLGHEVDREHFGEVSEGVRHRRDFVGAGIVPQIGHDFDPLLERFKG